MPGLQVERVAVAALGVVANSAPRIIPEVLETLKDWVEQDGSWPDG